MRAVATRRMDGYFCATKTVSAVGVVRAERSSPEIISLAHALYDSRAIVLGKL